MNENGTIIGAEVDPGLCAGSTICLQLAPGGFALDQRRQAVFTPDGAWTAEALAEAAEECPMAAIKLLRQPA